MYTHRNTHKNISNYVYLEAVLSVLPCKSGYDGLKDLNKLKNVVYDIVVYLGCENAHFQGSNFVSQMNGTYFIS